jgi:AraC family transcriptional regulator of adaptative response / DNA-3-methyladenine glycosylase II
LTDLADALGVGPRHLTRLFVQHCGAPPGAVARTRRIQRAKLLLDGTTLKITDIALAAGFGSVRSFTPRSGPSTTGRRPNYARAGTA